MTDDLNETLDYYRNREAREREMAEAASKPEVRAAHLAMAQRYAEMARMQSVEMKSSQTAGLAN